MDEDGRWIEIHRYSLGTVHLENGIIASLEIPDAKFSRAGGNYPDMRTWWIMMISASLAASEPAPTPVLVELFTSEGCSSCPPADELLSRLQQSQPVAGVEVIALSEHVDYWNRLGWADPFSSAALTERQRQYATVLRGNRVYTPQMVVDGQAGFVGSDSPQALRAIAEAAESRKPAWPCAAFKIRRPWRYVLIRDRPRTPM
jgi:hypothetical protein